MEEETRGGQSEHAARLTPLQLREQYHLNIADLAYKAKVGPASVYFMLLGQPIRRQDAEQVLATISTLSGQSYTLDNVEVVLIPEQESQVKPADATFPSDEESVK